MKFISLLLSFLFVSGLANSQCIFEDRLKCPNTIISAVPFLRIVPDARSAAMGDGGLATSADANSMHHNASKLAFIDSDLGLAASYSPWLRSLGLSDVYMAYLAGYKRLDDFQTLGASLRYFALGDLQFTDINGGSLGVGRPNEFEVAVAYARKLSENFSAGLTGKFIYSNLAGGQQIDNIDIVPATGGAVDISFTYQKPLRNNNGNLRLGAAFTNLGSKVSYTKSEFKDFMPANLGIGGALELDLDDYNQLTFMLDINKLLVPTPIDPEDTLNYDKNKNGFPDYREKSLFEGVFGSFGDAPNGFKEELREIMYSIGAEYWYNQQFAFRVGYYYEHPTKGNRQFLTAGLGLKYNVFGLNVSYLVPTSNQRSPLDNTLRFTLVFHLDKQAAPETETNE